MTYHYLISLLCTCVGGIIGASYGARGHEGVAYVGCALTAAFALGVAFFGGLHG